MRICFLDFWYHQAYWHWVKVGGPQLHGTADYWDIALQAAGHESKTFIANERADVLADVAKYDPDVVCVQNVGLWQPHLLKARGIHAKMIAFCSYAAERQNLMGWDVVFTSFKWLIDKLYQDGQYAEYLPLAFGKPVLERVPLSSTIMIERIYPVTFIGGLGFKIWKQGTEVLADIANAIPEFQWWGYKVGRLPEPLERSYKGEAWGCDYWRILMQSKIVINRHGEIARGQPRQNMREYEAPGCGCILLSDTTDDDKIPGVFCYKDSGVFAASMIKDMLKDWSGFAGWSRLSQQYILDNDCYENRVPQFLAAVEKIND